MPGDLPSDQKRARELALTKCQYKLVDNILYCVAKDKSLRVIPCLFHEAHDGVFGGNLKANKIVGELGKHYWWPGMSSDIIKWCQACLVSATRHLGCSVKPPILMVGTL